MNEEEFEVKDLRARLDEEGELAADYLEELLDIADLDGDLEISIQGERANIAIVAEDGGDRRLKRLIGRHGETLDALQELTRLAVQEQTNERSRLMLDLLGYRENQRAKIQDIAREAVAEVEETEEPVALRPMNPFERKVVHDVVAAAGLYSDSSGFGSSRHVVIYLEEPTVEEFAYEDEDEINSVESADSLESGISADEIDDYEVAADFGEEAEE
ncbi:protein jag [Arcanobacterium hippocoleae]|uniref:SpoIIIJ-associated protein n=1 Tax=Arcanobacterium hippocoleae TaxID=149017 RepID=A0ABU1T2I2_9ACTO|nr:R3H domain-containing nucleic acid-binding protein [Arcanobacterium hippocoleae]MDR6939579.1 spoIIIJ-associated protein [Arcanobacterium hippocoleae]